MKGNCELAEHNRKIEQAYWIERGGPELVDVVEHLSGYLTLCVCKNDASWTCLHCEARAALAKAKPAAGGEG